MADSTAIVRWLVALVVIHLLVRRPAERILGERSGMLSLPLFLLTAAYIYWLWGVTATIPQGPLPAWISAGMAAGFLWFTASREPHSERIKGFEISGEVVFAITMAAALWVRSLAPALEQTEKFTDMALFNGVLLDSHFPPEDRWLSGLPLNYYYFSHLLFVPLTRITRIPPEWATTLAVCTVAAMIASVGFALVWEITKNRLVALSAAAVSILLSNWEWVRAGSSWWTSSRAIANTITEFPYFSLLLGDFHAHFTALPWLGLAAAFAIKQKPLSPFLLGLAALALGVHYPLNPWELPFMAALFAAFWWKSPKQLAVVAVLSFLLYLPFWISYERPISGMAWVPLASRSSLQEFFLHWGLFYLPLGLVLVLSGKNLLKKSTGITLIAAAALAWPLGFCTSITLALLGLLWTTKKLTVDSPDGVLISLALLAITFCELVSLDHTFGDQLIRMNTVFKFYLMAWWAMALGVPMLLWRHRELLLRRRSIAGPVLIGVVGMSLGYPVRGTASRVGNFHHTKTLDGMAYWKTALPGEREAVNWLRDQTLGNDVIWEADGPAYHYYGRFSSFSGRPTILGWANHQRVWRKDGYPITGEREADIAQVQSNPTPQCLADFLKKYSVHYIVVGRLEREHFGAALLGEISKLQRVYSNETTAIYKAP